MKTKARKAKAAGYRPFDIVEHAPGPPTLSASAPEFLRMKPAGGRSAPPAGPRV